MGIKLQRALSWSRDAWLVLGITAVFFLFIEVTLSIFFHLRNAEESIDPEVDYRAFADTYQGADWTKKYYEEFLASNESQWLSYVYWRRKPFAGQFISIDSQGLRKTWASKYVEEKSGIQPKIFFFGGSTMWGTGARDDFTIPSIFSKRLAANKVNAQVTNFGESGYVSTQEVILLIRELQKGNIPDVIIFYDGVNDAYSAYQQHTAGIPQNEFNRAKEFNYSKKIAEAGMWPSVAGSITSRLHTVRIIKGIYDRLNIDHYSEKAQKNNSKSSSNQTDSNEDALVDDVISIYQKNIEIVKSLAKHYSFKPLFYWQPTIFGKKHLSKYEEKQSHRFRNIQAFLVKTYSRLMERDLTNNGKPEFHNLHALFSEVSEPLFIDWCHLGEAGNEYVAEKMVANTIHILKDSFSVERKITSPDHFTSLNEYAK